MQNFIGPMNIKCSALKEIAVFAQITAIQLLIFPQVHPKLCTPVQVTSKFAQCTNFSSLILVIDERAYFKDLEIDEEFQLLNMT